MESIQEEQKQIILEFSRFTDWMDKYTFLIEFGRKLNSEHPSLKEEKNLIKGCQSRVWILPEVKDGLINFYADSDALITKGIVALLLRVYSGRTAEDILSADLVFIDEIGLKQNLSPTRSNGLLEMIKQIKLYATVFKLQSK